MKYAIHHNFNGKITDLMSKCFLQNAQDPFRLIADTIYEDKGINYLSKIETLEKNIVTLEEKIKTLEEKIETYETCNALGIVVTEDGEQDMKGAYETFGKSMFDSEDSSVSETGSDNVMIDKKPIKESTTDIAEAMIEDDTFDSVNDESNSFKPLLICEKSMDQSNITLEETFSSSSLIISDELLDLPVIVYDEHPVHPPVVCHDELEALIDSISERTINTNQATNAIMCTDINNMELDSETLEIEHALEAIHSSVTSDYNYDITMNVEPNAVLEKVCDINSTKTSDQSLDDADFEPDYEDSD